MINLVELKERQELRTVDITLIPNIRDISISNLTFNDHTASTTDLIITHLTTTTTTTRCIPNLEPMLPTTWVMSTTTRDTITQWQMWEWSIKEWPTEEGTDDPWCIDKSIIDWLRFLIKKKLTTHYLFIKIRILLTWLIKIPFIVTKSHSDQTSSYQSLLVWFHQQLIP